MEPNLNKQPNTPDILQRNPVTNTGGYAEKFLLKKRELGFTIAKKEQELADVIQQSMGNPQASKESYTKLIALIKNEIEILKFKRENLHNETIH